MALYLSGRYWWLGIAGIVIFSLLIFHALSEPASTPVIKPKTAQITRQKPVSKKVAIPTHPVLDLFNPSSASITRDQSISRTRSELEQLLVISIILQRCNHITNAEKSNITHAAQTYVVRSKLFSDSATLIQELNESAQRTYDLVYANTRCNEPSLEQLKIQTLAWQSRFTRPQY